MLAELVQTHTSDQLLLSGLLVKGDTNKPAIIHIHGYEGDFYTNKFVSVIGEAAQKQGNAFLTIQHRGTGVRTDFYTLPDGDRYIGSYYELLEEAHLDISAWIKFLLNLGYQEFILEGHSLGTIKAVRYLFEGEYKDKIKKLILLAPFDKNWLLISAAGSKTELTKQYETAMQKVAAGEGEQLAPKNYDSAPHSYANFASWAKDDEIGRMFDFYNDTYTFPLLTKIKIPVKILVGTKDIFFHPMNPDKPEQALDLLITHLPAGEGKLFDGATHGFAGYEEILAQEVVKFL